MRVVIAALLVPFPVQHQYDRVGLRSVMPVSIYRNIWSVTEDVYNFFIYQKSAPKFIDFRCFSVIILLNTLCLGSYCMTLTEYRESIPMSVPELARAAGIDPQTLRNAESGQRISARVARTIAEALSEALGRTITYRDIEGLDVRL